MARCKSCNKEKGMFEGGGGLCGECLAASIVGERTKTHEQRLAEEQANIAENERVKKSAEQLIVTTEAFVGEVERIDVVATEVVLGMNLFKDVLANMRDIFGGRSGTVQNTLEDARKIAFEDLRIKAAKLGAEAIIAIDINYHSISTGSAVNMMMVSVSGTAVKWAK